MPDYGTETLQFAGSGAATVAALGDEVEAPFDADITDVVITAGTAPVDTDPVGAALQADVKVNGTSVFDTPLGTVATIAEAQTGGTGGLDDSATEFDFAPTGGENNLQNGVSIVIGSEQMLVTGVTGTSLINEDGVTPVFKVTVTRGTAGTTAATHDAGDDVLPAPPFIADGENKSGSEDQPFSAVVATPISKGDLISAAITKVGDDTAGSDVQVEVVLTQR